MKRFIAVLLALNAALAAAPSQAREEGGSAGTRGGGDVLVCRKGLRGTHLADTFGLKAGGVLRVGTGLSEAVLVDSYLDALRGQDAALGKLIAERLAKLEFVAVDRLKELDDDDLQVPSGCRKRQLGVQDLATGRVEYHAGRFADLSNEERALFKIHEAFIAEKKFPGVPTTAIREAVAAIPASETFAGFLVRTLLKNRILPEFKWEIVEDMLIHFWAITYAQELHRSNFADFCSSHDVFREVKEEMALKDELLGGGVRFHEATAREIYLAMKATTWHEYFANGSPERFAAALASGTNLAGFSIQLAAMGTPRMQGIDSIDLQKIDESMNRLLGKCAVPFAGHAEEIRRDWASYRKTVETLRAKQ